jgi:hypothetical protein
MKISSTRWLENISVRIDEFDNGTVDTYIYINHELFTRQSNLSPSRASTEIGAAVFEEAK